MKKITTSLLLVLAFVACSEQDSNRPANVKEVVKEAFAKRANVKAIKAELITTDGFSELTAKKDNEKLLAEMSDNGKDFKFFSDMGDTQISFDGSKYVVVNHNDKWFYSFENPQEYSRSLSNHAETLRNFLPFASTEDFAVNVDTSAAYKDFKWENDTTLNNEEAYHISKKSNDDNLGLDFYTDQIISKASGFPLIVNSTVRNGEHLVQKEEMIVKNIDIVADIEDSKFSLEIPEAYKTYDQYIAEYEKSKQDENDKTTEITPVELKEGDIVPNWDLKDADGKLVSLESLRGKPVILDFWGTWCVWCVVAMPKIEAVYQEMGDKIHVYGISCKEPEGADPKAFLKEKKASYPTLVNGDNVAKLLNVQGYPTLLVIDKDGKLLYKHSGYDKDMDKTLIKILNDNL